MLPFAQPTKIIYDYDCFCCNGHNRCLLCDEMIHSYNHKITINKVTYHRGCANEFLNNIIMAIGEYDKVDFIIKKRSKMKPYIIQCPVHLQTQLDINITPFPDYIKENIKNGSTAMACPECGTVMRKLEDKK